VNQRLNPLKYGTGSNLTDAGRAAARADLIHEVVDSSVRHVPGPGRPR
jgi:hypothetical protein